MKKIYFLFALSVLTMLASCTKEETRECVETASNEQKEVSIIPIETALETLEDFINETQESSTKGNIGRDIISIETHYSNMAMTRSGETLPDAYLVNFDNEGGYAVLGANTSVDPIIAFVEEGNNNWDSIMNPEDEERSSFEDDILNSGIKPSKLVSMCVNAALNSTKEDRPETKTDTEIFTTDIGPLTNNQRFGQHVTYCHKPNGGYVLDGCASTALGIIVAYNNYPYISSDFEVLDYTKCNTYDGTAIRYYLDKEELFLPLQDYYKNSSAIPSVSSMTNEKKIELLTNFDKNIIKVHGTPNIKKDEQPFRRTRYKLTSAIFYLTDNIVLGWTGTGALPSAIATGLTNLGYTNVKKYQTSSLNSDQLQRIVEMLQLGKPVLMCGWELAHLDVSHYWVVDGVAISNKRELIHCNWGWDGDANGWFVTNCISSSQPKTKSTGTANDWANLIVYTYNMASTTPYKYAHKVYDMRLTY